MSLFCETDTERAVGLLRQYQANLTSPEEQALKTSVGKVSAILGSQLFKSYSYSVMTNLC
uniref:L27-1 domain-containing protein n=1 Tax=Sphaeramia orbicularis TaxID=375764 RepID=A0A672ZR53_9TELE